MARKQRFELSATIKCIAIGGIVQYYKKKKVKAVEAVKINNLADIGTVLNSCPHIDKLVDILWGKNDVADETFYAFFVLHGEWEGENWPEYQEVKWGQYVVWNSKKVWVLDADEFEEKYEASRVSFNPNLIFSTSTNTENNSINYIRKNVEH